MSSNPLGLPLRQGLAMLVKGATWRLEQIAAYDSPFHSLDYNHAGQIMAFSIGHPSDEEVAHYARFVGLGPHHFDSSVGCIWWELEDLAAPL